MPNAKDVFLRALELVSLDERSAFIAKECVGDPKLQRLVEELLAAHDDPDSYLERPAASFDIGATTLAGGNDSGLSDSSSSHHGRFLPGTRVAERYRIVSLLGRGGMGEVYRADDLRLGQTVALKFLPPELAKDAKRLEYFHNEVKLARQISHPNVCRVYDIGEVDGQHFISMEYIDGEDLKTLLHRIGRLPKDKGVQIAQQLCSGLSAAHNKGVLHRDLKPANIMLDGQGQVRITDFGLATMSVDGENVIGMSGTPAYMAPEQLLRGQTSVQSDIYSLGLILYELFSGKSAYNVSSLPELRRLHQESSSVTPPSRHVDELDPAVERVILSVLEPDPLNRPKSAAQISAALPGGNPLAAALAAGETPSPELVAASGPTGALSPRVAGTLLGIIFIGLAFTYFASSKTQLINQLDLKKPPEVLAERARQVISHFGYDDQMADSAYGFQDQSWEVLRKYPSESSISQRWVVKATDARPGIKFWYRESPTRLFQNEIFQGSSFYGGRVAFGGPNWTEPGMRGVRLDPRGYLREFRAVPLQRAVTTARPGTIDWQGRLDPDVLGFDIAALRDADWSMPSLVAADQTQAWDGVWPGTASEIHLQAAAYQGRLVEVRFFSRSQLGLERSNSVASVRTFLPVRIFLQFLALAVGVVLAIRNVILGRGDLKAAKPLATWCFSLMFVKWIFQASHVQHQDEFGLLLAGIQEAAGYTFNVILMYFALEPFVRRHWPQLLVSWTRLMRLRIRDPLVGRDVLVGCCLAACLSVLSNLARLSGVYQPIKRYSLGGFDHLVFTSIHSHEFAIFYAIVGLVLLLMLHMIFRFQWIAMILLAFLLAHFAVVENSATLTGWLPAIFVGAIPTYMASRFGLLFMVVYFTISNMLVQPITSDVTLFYFPNGLMVLGAVALVAAYGYRTSTNRGHRNIPSAY